MCIRDSLISAGFDAAKGDPFGQCAVTEAGYGAMVRIMMGICPRVLCLLEGGYNLESIRRSAVGCVQALHQDDSLPALDTTQLVRPSAVVAVQQTQRALAKFWPI
eukprot:TRINITY_DN21763_c0_g1_i1.p2 TRINITY_DN21763_c0_g1~~TRINITY_DN21763_c0_g1_i1.p2  ORF type:complete len:105 (+),score=30.47 TRINITY_DN21763_c0_g1_i1:177-491(+)